MCGRVHYHNRQLAGLRHKGDAGDGLVYWSGKKGRGVVLWWVMEDVG